MRASTRFFLTSIGMIFLGFGGGTGSITPPVSRNAPPSSDPNTVVVSNNQYTPAAKTVAVGTSIQWNWSSCTPNGAYGDEVCTDHTVTFDDGVTSSTQSSGAYTRSFTAAGTYKYHCKVHGLAMSGTVIVQ